MSKHGGGIITAAHIPGTEDILRADIAFHCGDRDFYDFPALQRVCKERPTPSPAFVCIHLGTKSFVAGGHYKNNYIISENQIDLAKDKGDQKQVRTIQTINRDFDMFDKALYYAFDMTDARRTNYAEFYGTERDIPVFQTHRLSTLHAIISPLYLYQQYPSWNIPKIDDRKSFLEKLPKALWRGEMSGVVLSPWGLTGVHSIARHTTLTEEQKIALLRQSARFRICYDGNEDDKIDVALVINWGGTAYPEPIQFLERLCRPRITQQAHLDYRYLLALDGYDWPSSWYWMLNTNSVVLRQESPWQTFGDNYFVPWVHFVPLNADASDLTEKIDWCEHHLIECQRLIENAHAAWRVLFDSRFQVERRRANIEFYNLCMRDGKTAA